MKIEGVNVDKQSRCKHWHGANDILAIKFKCCNRWFSCIECHNELTDHDVIKWENAQFSDKAIYCGHCGHIFSIKEYLDSSNFCPKCNAKFNPRCKNHHHLYFKI